MGMSFSPMYQPITSSNLTVDGDLNLGQYDIIATDGEFDTVEADGFVGGVGNFSSVLTADSLFPKYNVTSEVLANPTFTFTGASFSSPQNQPVGTTILYNNTLYPTDMALDYFKFANLELVDYIEIKTFSNATNPSLRAVRVYVGEELVLTNQSEGSKTYQLLPDDFFKNVKIESYVDRNTFVAGINGATIGNAYIYK